MKNKMRFSLLVAGVASLCNVAFAQSVDQGKKFLYYERFKSANDVFDKILALFFIPQITQKRHCVRS